MNLFASRLNCSRSVSGLATHVARLQRCCKAKDLGAAKMVHSRIPEQLLKDKYLANLLLQTYGQCGSLKDARLVFQCMIKKNVFSWNIMIAAYSQNGHIPEAGNLFHAMPSRDAVSWNAIIAAYARNGHGEEAIYLFCCMSLEDVEPTRVTFVSVVDAFTSLGLLAEGKVGLDQHWQDVSVATSVLHMYGNRGCLESAKLVFDMMPQRNVVTWTTLVATYASRGHLDFARTAFKRMAQRNIISWTTMATACLQAGEFEEGRLLFESMPQKDLVAWNTMLAGYARSGQEAHALETFTRMRFNGIAIDRCTCFGVLDACTTIQEGKRIHAEIQRSGIADDIAVGTALLNMYSRLEDIERALNVFRKMPQRNVVTWNSLIAAYAKNGPTSKAIKMFEQVPQRTLLTYNAALAAYAVSNMTTEASALFEAMPETSIETWNIMVGGFAQAGRAEEALELACNMQLEGYPPDKITFIILVDACSRLATMSRGRAIHTDIAHHGLTSDLEVCTALVDMYGKCGGVENAVCVFASVASRDLILWTALIAAYARNGHGKVAHETFCQMVLEGANPNAVTFMTIAFACSHSGRYMDGLQYLSCMRSEYDVAPNKVHYVCTVDMLARLGKLDEAEELIRNMPREDYMVWRALLGACGTHGDADRCARAAQRLAELEPRISMPYIFLSKLYASCSSSQELGF